VTSQYGGVHRGMRSSHHLLQLAVAESGAVFRMLRSLGVYVQGLDRLLANNGVAMAAARRKAGGLQWRWLVVAGLTPPPPPPPPPPIFWFFFWGRGFHYRPGSAAHPPKKHGPGPRGLRAHTVSTHPQLVFFGGGWSNYLGFWFQNCFGFWPGCWLLAGPAASCSLPGRAADLIMADGCSFFCVWFILRIITDMTEPSHPAIGYKSQQLSLRVRRRSRWP
jgi:hypothetical protein